MQRIKHFWICLLLLLVSNATAQQVQTTRIVINAPSNPSGYGWVPITRAWLTNGQNGPIGRTPNGQGQFFMVGGATSQIWLTDNNGYGSLHTINVSGAYDTIVIDVQGPVITSGVRPFIYSKYKGFNVQVSPVTYLPHTRVPF